MKNLTIKFILPVLTIFIFIIAPACHPSENKADQTHADHHDQASTEHHEAGHDHEGALSAKLTLNNGAKWRADDPTNKNVASLISIGEEFSKKSNIALEDYHAFGKEINSGINKMIQECTMEGEADQALHRWFLPLLAHSGTLQKAIDTTGLSSTTSEMINRMGIYTDYFE